MSQPDNNALAYLEDADELPSTNRYPVADLPMLRRSLAALALAGLVPWALSQEAPPVELPPVRAMTGMGFAAPESMLHDETADVYLVSNINGGPLEVDGNGFISRVSPDGELLDLRWIDGEDEDVDLDAPKGMALAGHTLFVADIDQVRMFDRETGAPTGSAEITGASFLNGVTPTGDGGVFVTDTGVDADFQPSGSAAIYRVGEDGQVSEVLASDELGAPNGIASVGPGELVVVTFSDPGRIITVTEGEITESRELTAGSLDGVVALEGGDLLISSWTAAALLRVEQDGSAELVVEDVEGPADIGFDATRQRVLIPLLNSNELRMVDLPGAAQR